MPRATHKAFLIIGSLLLLASFCYGDNKKELPPLDPTRPIYQKKVGFPSKVITWPILGGLQESRLPDPVTVGELKKRLEMQDLRHKQTMRDKERERDVNQKEWESFWGGLLKIAGWVLIALGVAGHSCTTFPLIKNWASSIITLGVAGVIGGLAIQKTVQADKYLTVAFWLLIGFLVMYRLKDWSFSHIGIIQTAKGKIKKRLHDYKIPNLNHEPGQKASTDKEG